MDYPMWCGGRDKRVPPRDRIGGARLSCPLNLDGLSNIALRTRQTRPAEDGPDKQVPPKLQRGMLIVPVVLTTGGFRANKTSPRRER